MASISLIKMISSGLLLWLNLILIGNALFIPYPTSFGDELRFGIQIRVPYTIALPKPISVIRRRRHINDTEEIEMNFDLSSKEVNGALLSSIFTWIGVEDPDCHKRFICMISQNSHKYSPISDIILQHLNPHRHNITHLGTAETDPSLMDFYLLGLQPETDCSKETALCQSNPDKFINWNVMKMLQVMKTFVDFKFE